MDMEQDQSELLELHQQSVLTKLMPDPYLQQSLIVIFQKKCYLLPARAPGNVISIWIRH